MRRSPEEIDAVQKADEQRRVAERRQGAANIGGQKDKEYYNMHVMKPRRIGPQQRPDHNHGRPRGADQAGDHRPERQDGGVNERCGAHAARDQYAARHDVERRQHGDKP
jgi:hypothetical protein